MRINIKSDAEIETRVRESINFAGVDDFWFRDKRYGRGVESIGIVLMCRLPQFGFRQRVKYDKKTRHLSIDVMLDYDQMTSIVKNGQHTEPSESADAVRDGIIRTRIVKEVPKAIRDLIGKKRDSLSEFDVDSFESDLRKCLLEGGVEQVASEYAENVQKRRQEYDAKRGQN